MRKILLSAIVFMTIVGTGFSQTLDISGTVVEEGTNEPLIGATILIQGTETGTITDIDGSFSLSDVPSDAILEIFYVGYVTMTIPVTEVLLGPIELAPGTETLAEVVVTGYGEQTKKEITGAVSVITSESIEALNPTNVEQALQGQVAGVQITGTSGAPGSNANIRIRGIGTNGDSQPLILIDGAVVEDLSVINPNDIASVNVLKDASAAIYGARASNGVILITTKTGRRNTPLSIDFSTYAGWQQTSRQLDLLNATEYGVIINEAHAAGGSSAPFPNLGILGIGTDWQELAFQDATIFNANLTASGGTANSTYSFSGSILDQDGIVGGDKSGFQRMSLRGNYTTKIANRFDIESTLTYTNTNRNTLPENALGSVLFNAVNMGPNLSVREDRDLNNNGTIEENEKNLFTLAEGFGAEVINPIAQIANSHDNVKVNKLNGRFGIDVPILSNLSVYTAIQFNHAKVKSFSFAPEADYGSGKVFNLDRNRVVETDQTFEDYTYDLTFNYDQSFGTGHNLKGLLGMSVFKTTGDIEQYIGFDIPDNDVANASRENASDIIDPFANVDTRFDSRLLSYFARVRYDYQNRYLFSAAIRRDGSTKFGPRNRFGYFPSVSIGWVVSEEPFFQSSYSTDYVKLRASAGILGNDRIPGDGFRSLLSGEGVYVFNDELFFGTAIGPLSNPEIRWEEQEAFDVGIDISVLDQMVDLTIDYYKRRTKDLLLIPPVSGILGITAPGSRAPIVNAGTVENSGLEMHLGIYKRLSEEVDIDFNFNWTTINYNEVLSVNNGLGFIEGGVFGVGQNAPSRMEEGRPIGYFYGYRTDGIFQNLAQVEAHAVQANAKPGDLKFVDLNNDGQIDNDDRTYIGDPIPDYTFGFNFNLGVKGFDFQLSAFGSLGHDIVRNYERQQNLANKSKYVLNRWRGEGTSSDYPRITTGASPNTLFSDFYVEDGSFLRIQNVQIGYSFNEDVLEKINMDNLRLYISVNNLYTFTEYTGFDPTTSNGAPIGGGIDQGFYPTPSTFLFGLNAKF